MSELMRISLSLENDLLKEFGRLVDQEGYENRSEYIRDLIRERIGRRRWQSGEEVVGTLTLIYNHHQRGLTEKLVELQHHWGGQVLASTHIHLRHELCAEMIMLRGRGRDIEALADALRRRPGVLEAGLAVSGVAGAGVE